MLQATHLPPVEVEELRALASLEGEIEVVGATDDGGQVDSQRLPLLPATSTRHMDCAEELTSEAVHTDFYLTATQSTGYTGAKGTRQFVAESHMLKLDIVAIVNVTDIDTDVVALLGLHSTRESHGLGLHTTEGTECIDRLHALVGRHDGRERAVSIVLELLDSHATAKASTSGQLTRMIEEIGMSFVVGHTAVVGKRTRVAQRHDDTCVFPRAYGRRCRAVGDVFRHSTSSIQQLVR